MLLSLTIGAITHWNPIVVIHQPLKPFTEEMWPRCIAVCQLSHGVDTSAIHSFMAKVVGICSSHY